MSIDGNIYNEVSVNKWQLGHVFGITEPNNSNWGGVISIIKDNERNDYYLISDYTNHSFEFYKYTRNKRGVYELFDKPEFIWSFN